MTKRPVYVALIIIAAIAVLAIAAMQLRAPRGPVMYAELHAAPGLREGAPVVFRGIAVGEVTHIGFVPEGLRLTIALNRPDVPLRRGDGVRVRPNGVFGDMTLELVPGRHCGRRACRHRLSGGRARRGNAAAAGRRRSSAAPARARDHR